MHGFPVGHSVHLFFLGAPSGSGSASKTARIVEKSLGSGSVLLGGAGKSDWRSYTVDCSLRDRHQPDRYSAQVSWTIRQQLLMRPKVVLSSKSLPLAAAKTNVAWQSREICHKGVESSSVEFSRPVTRTSPRRGLPKHLRAIPTVASEGRVTFRWWSVPRGKSDS